MSTYFRFDIFFSRQHILIRYNLDWFCPINKNPKVTPTAQMNLLNWGKQTTHPGFLLGCPWNPHPGCPHPGCHCPGCPRPGCPRPPGCPCPGYPHRRGRPLGCWKWARHMFSCHDSSTSCTADCFCHTPVPFVVVITFILILLLARICWEKWRPKPRQRCWWLPSSWKCVVV